MTYKAKSITDNTSIPANSESAVIYTVPTGRTAKITYIWHSTSTYIYLNGSRVVFMTSTVPLDLIDKGIYLSEGDEITLYNNTSSAIFPLFYMCVIEEYEV